MSQTESADDLLLCEVVSCSNFNDAKCLKTGHCRIQSRVKHYKNKSTQHNFVFQSCSQGLTELQRPCGRVVGKRVKNVAQDGLNISV